MRAPQRIRQGCCRCSRSCRSTLQPRVAQGLAGQCEGRRGGFRVALALKPDYLDAGINLGLTLMKERKAGEAVQQFDDLAKRFPGNPAVQNNLGLALLEHGDLKEAAGAFRQSLRLNSNSAEAHYNLALALSKEGEHQAAAAEFKKARDLNPALSPP